jgi:lactate permease
VYVEDFDPVAGSLGLTAMFAVLPILALLVLLGGFKVPSHRAAPMALAIAMAVAIGVYRMPSEQTVMAALEGGAFALFPIMWIVVTAIWVFNMTVDSGHFAVLRRSVERVSEDQRIQAVMVAFCFGALLEALAGFGAPVAITSMMMVALGFQPLKAASIALVANTAPVPFGAVAIPITTRTTSPSPEPPTRLRSRIPDATLAAASRTPAPVPRPAPVGCRPDRNSR